MTMLPGGRTRSLGRAVGPRGSGYVHKAARDQAPQATYIDRRNQVQPLYAVDSFGTHQLPIYLERLGPIRCGKCGTQNPGPGGGVQVVCANPQCRTPLGADNRVPRMYCPGCNDALLNETGIIGANSTRGMRCPNCGVSWKTSESMPVGIGLEMR